MAEETQYRRLTRARNMEWVGVASVSRSSLWLGPDHLLGVYSNGYTESYKRFYFRDIQAIIIVASRRRAIWNWVLTVPFAICLAVVISVVMQPGGGENLWVAGLLGGIGVILAVLLAVNNWLGPACQTQIRTAVQTEFLPSLARLKKTRFILAQLRPLIAAAQGELAPGDVETRMKAWVGSIGGTTSTEASPVPPANVEPDAPPVIEP